ncbi:hypothetical protein [Selenomonas sp. oral taxon 136]|uniref:hypothetical protein n=1 Tax=Selenomonas sp. oral taxon 136 TaxID=713030 RepID=UPI0007683394|nr:hypothetical protein [Selenomonas sp. oral taxon 136]AME03664.1 hypothetical protein AXE86_06035 [Selenomonas sp. oral taxon 136]
MIPAMLVSAVCREVEAATANYRMKAEGQADKKVSVYAQHIPDDEFKDDTYYPLVVVSWQKTEDVTEPDKLGAEAVIGLTFGVYGEDKEAWRDLLSIMERVRQRLLIFRKLDNRFRIVLPTKFETIENQPYPYWFGYATLTYTVAQPNEQMAADWHRIERDE